MSIESLVAHYGLVALFLGAALEGETVVVAGGLLAHEHLLPLPGAMAAAALGSFTADQLFFFAGRRLRDHRWVRAIAEKRAFARAIALLEAHPIKFILAFRFIYGFRTVSPVAIGTSRVPARLYLPLNAIAAVVWGIAFTTVGYFFGRAFQALLGRLRPSTHTVLIILAAIVVVVALWQAALWLRRRRATS